MHSVKPSPSPSSLPTRVPAGPQVPRSEIQCGTCAGEKRRQPGILGAVVAVAVGRLFWHSYDPPSARRLANFTDDGVSDPPKARHEWVELTSQSDEALRVWCRHHGPGTVRSADAVRASGSVPVNFTAPR